MSDEEKEMMDDETDEVIIVMTDEDGNESYYCEEMIIPVGEDNFALLVPALSDEEAAEADDDAAEEREDEAFFAKIVLDENGEETYVEPSDEEFEAVCRAYERILDDEEEEEESLEYEILAPDAAKSREAKRQGMLDLCPFRTAYQRDRDRILHSKAFRRMKHKTQVYIMSGDHYRTRMTHSL